jgi:NADH-ubiquinone oxidoreductase chain 3
VQFLTYVTFFKLILFLILTFIGLLLGLFLKIVAYAVSEKVLLQREELTPYECGFEHHSLARIPFSLRYFFLTLIFLIFDLEILFLVFCPFVIYSSFRILSFLVILFFICFLFLGLIYE